MTLFRKSNQSLKNKSIQLLIIEIVFIILNITLCIFIQTTTASYISDLQQIAPDITSISDITDKVTQQSQIQQLVATLGPATQKMIFLLFFLTPVVLLALWIVCQGSIWKRLLSSAKGYFKRITLSTVLAGAILIAAALMVENLWIISILSFIIYYALTISYLSASTTTYKKEFLSTITRVRRFGLWIILLFLTGFALLILSFVFSISYTSGSWFAGSSLSLAMYMILIIVLNVYIKTKISKIYCSNQRNL
jgi:hypothetical protein